VSDKKVVYLAHRNDTPTATTEVLVCGGCQNKTWVAEYGVRGSSFPRLRCAACGEGAGYFGWVDDTEALTE
jgi:hypothetical protein